MEPPSPIADEALEAVAADVAERLRGIGKRAPRDVRRRIRGVLERTWALIGDEEASIAARLSCARALEDLSHELRGREGFVPQFYARGRLAIVWAFEPVRIRPAIRHARVEKHFDRYESRVVRAERRLRYFLERAGLEVEADKRAVPPWLKPYGKFEEYHELLWGRMSSGQETP